ncbi:hypothetical protein M3484_00740 [Pseudomonas sp. GX19020]|uniref:hypothetical protein n=1 Tax=Pseudomonadota TaxID=1224 RepID=UPI00089B443E|nr:MULTISPECIES: hypothetical protein [Pseudomonadota]MCL4065103.1 hypothetical protein [Pseudomonas sp. GX19020]SEB67592.1 hypothetical protein SAMN05519105_1064 [Rhodobacter sp. 24-YEA-8]
MDLTFPINFIGHDEWMDSGYDLDLAGGEVVTRDGEVIGRWRVADYDPNAAYGEEDGRYEFIPQGADAAIITEDFLELDSRGSRGFALSTICGAIRDWYNAENPNFPISTKRPKA